MGYLKNGAWADEWYDTKSTGGKFVRTGAQFRSWIKADKSNEFVPEADRYHLYVSLACPWAHRVIIMRKLKKLESVIGLSVVSPYMLENGWTFEKYKDLGGDDLYNLDYLYQIYLKSNESYEGRVTVPVLWDKKNETIVNNESSEIIRMLNSEFSNFTDDATDYYPLELRDEIDAVNEFVYDGINNGVYKVGFATAQDVYEVEFKKLFEALDKVEVMLEGKKFLVGDRMTEADIRLFTTLARFDAVYYSHFKCNLRHLSDYKNLHNFMMNMMSVDEIALTVNFDHIKTHYYASQKTINPTGIVPVGPQFTVN